MSPEPQCRPALLTIARTAEILAVAERTVRRLIGRGELPPIRLGRLVRIREQDLDRFIEQRMRPLG